MKKFKSHIHLLTDGIQNFIKNYSVVIVFFVFSYSIFLRIYNLGEQSFWIDEGFSSYSTIAGSNLQYYLHNISQQISFSVFGISDFSARFPSVIFSLITIFLVYFISFELFKNKKQALFASFIFAFLTWEIIWARQARFYSLLQFLFCLNVYLSLHIFKQYSHLKHSIHSILLYIGTIFHPFLWANVVLSLGVYLGKLFQSILLNKSLKLSFLKRNFIHILGFFSPLFLIGIHQSLSVGKNSIPGEEIKVLPNELILHYIEQYSQHLISETGILYILGIMGMILLAYQRKLLASFILAGGFLFIFYVISQKGYLFHTRYVLILYPLLIILGSYTLFFIHGKIKNIFMTSSIVLLLTFLIFFTGKFTFVPQIHYYIDSTSPQPNFKKAYSIIPPKQKVVSGFPMLCMWYYEKKGLGNCQYSLAINYVGDQGTREAFLKRGEDNYTDIIYLSDIEKLIPGEIYYFVLDDLSYRQIINKNILKNLLNNGKIIFQGGQKYNSIMVIKYIKK